MLLQYWEFFLSRTLENFCCWQKKPNVDIAERGKSFKGSVLLVIFSLNCFGSHILHTTLNVQGQVTTYFEQVT